MHHPWLLARLLVIALSVQLSAVFAEAQTFSSASSIANGGAGRASVEANDITNLNPAMLVHLRNRDLHTFATTDAWSVGISDNAVDSIVPAALTYSRSKFGENAFETKSDDLRLSLAGFVAKNLSMGVTASQRTYHRGPMDWMQVNADLGFAWIATPKLGFALVGYDLMSPNENLPEDLRSTRRSGVGATYLLNETFRLRADYVSGRENNFGRGSTLLGYEVIFNDFVAFRLGYSNEKEAERDLMGAGIGFDLPRFRLNYAYQSALRGVSEVRHSVDLGIPF